MKGKIWESRKWCASSSSHACILNHPLSSSAAIFPNRMLGLWRLQRQSFIIAGLFYSTSCMPSHPNSPSRCCLPLPNGARKFSAHLLLGGVGVWDQWWIRRPHPRCCSFSHWPLEFSSVGTWGVCLPPTVPGAGCPAALC